MVVGDGYPAWSPAALVLDEQDAITVFDFKTKLELQISGLGCGYLPRYLVQRFIDAGALVEKRVTPDVATDSVWVGWNEHTEGLASQWWRENILASPEIMALYAP